MKRRDTLELDEFGNEVRLCGTCAHEVEPGTVHLSDDEGCTIKPQRIKGRES